MPISIFRALDGFLIGEGMQHIHLFVLAWFLADHIFLNLTLVDDLRPVKHRCYSETTSVAMSLAFCCKIA